MTSGNPLPAGEAKRRSMGALASFFAPRLRGARPVLYSTWGRRNGLGPYQKKGRAGDTVFDVFKYEDEEQTKYTQFNL